MDETTLFMIATVAIGYLLGSIPFGLLLTRAAGAGDLRRIGSGNIGATNVLRTGRRGLAAATLLLDGAKGAVPVLLAAIAFGSFYPALAACAAVIGHCYPVWLRFRGGKGVATGLGTMLGLSPTLGLIGCVVWLAGFGASRISSVGSLSAFAALAVLGFLFLDLPASLAPLAIALLIAWRHRGNIARLRAGTEPKVGQKAGQNPGQNRGATTRRRPRPVR